MASQGLVGIALLSALRRPRYSASVAPAMAAPELKRDCNGPGSTNRGEGRTASPTKEEHPVSRASITKSHQKIQELSWDPTYVSPVEKYATDYTFEKAPKKDPLKQVLRSYFPMEEEKDNRVFGAMDGAIRGNMFRQVQERWMEWQKLFLSI